MVHVDDQDRVYVAGDTTQEVRVYDATGTLEHSYPGRTVSGNVCGFVVGDEALFTAHLFRGTIAKHPIGSEDAPTPFKLDPELAKNTYSVSVAHNGNLLVGCGRGNGKVFEMDPGTGELVGLFVDLEEHGTFGVSTIAYLEDRHSYIFPCATGLLEYDATGQFKERHQINSVYKVAAISKARRPDVIERLAEHDAAL